MQFLWEIHKERIAREYSMFVPAQLLRIWREQRPSNQGELEYHGVGWESLLHGDGLASGLIFVP
jgi:hypothetical protein